MKRGVQVSIFVVCVAFSVAAAYNVMADNGDVLKMANVVACGDQGPACPAQMTRMERTPFWQIFELHTPKRTVDVKCTRAFVMVGDYSCVVR